MSEVYTCTSNPPINSTSSYEINKSFEDKPHVCTCCPYILKFKVMCCGFMVGVSIMEVAKMRLRFAVLEMRWNKKTFLTMCNKRLKERDIMCFFM